MANQWFKFYGAEYLSDPKMDMLTVQERSCWLTILCIASQSGGIIKFLSVEALLNKSGVHFNPYDTTEWNNSLNVLQNFEKFEMIKVKENGSIEILNWNKRQDSALTGYERVKKHRENKAKKENDNEMITDDNDNDNTRIEEKRIEENRIDQERAVLEQHKEEKNSKFEIKKFTEAKKEIQRTADANAWLDQAWLEDMAGKWFLKFNQQIPKNKIEFELQKFISYWTEQSLGGKKARWEKQEVFDPQRRLITWFSKFAENYQSKNQNNKYQVSEV